MSHRLTFALFVVLPGAVVAAPEPRFVPVEEKGGSLVVAVTTTVNRTVVQTVTVFENGVPVTKAVPVVVPETVTTYRKLDAEAGEYFTPSGERIDPKKLADVLKKGAVVAIANDGKPLDPDVVKKNKGLVAILVPKADKPAPVAKKEPAADSPFVTDGWLKDGAVVINRDTITYEQQIRQEARTTADGKRETVAVTVKVPVTRRVTVTLDPKATEVQTPEGKILDAADWGKVLKEKGKVIVSPNGRPVPDEFRKAHKDVAAVILIKAAK